MNEVKITLRQIEVSDVGSIESLASSPFHKIIRFPFDFGAAEEWLDSQSREDGIFFVITAAKEGSAKIVGLCGFCEISWVCRRAKIFFAMVDRDRCKASIQNQPPTKQAFSKLLEYGFKTLGLNKLSIAIAENNKSLSALEDLGFVVEGISEAEEFLDGKFRQVVHLSLTAAEYGGQNAGNPS